MGDTWRASKIKGMGEATVPHPVIVGRGRLEDHDPSPSVNEPRLCASLFFYGEGASCLFTMM